MIRPVTPADFAAIGELANVTWRACFRDVISEAQIEYMLAQRYTPEALARAIGGMAFDLLLADGTPAAFTAHGPAQEAQPPSWKLHQLYVHPAFQGRGHGSRLIHHVESVARGRGARRVVLTVNRHNLRARAIYERHGFVVREPVVADIGCGFVMDDYLMEKALS